ncbi:hypothetical protein ACTXT7_009382 [Hymenolepis weldensis]
MRKCKHLLLKTYIHPKPNLRLPPYLKRHVQNSSPHNPDCPLPYQLLPLLFPPFASHPFPIVH